MLSGQRGAQQESSSVHHRHKGEVEKEDNARKVVLIFSIIRLDYLL